MSSTSSPTLIIEVRSRRAERSIVAITLTLAALVPWIMTGPTPLGALCGSVVSLLLLTSGFRWSGWLGGRRRIEALCWISDNRWVLTDGAGREAEATLGRGSRVGRLAIWLQWRTTTDAFVRTPSMLLTALDIPPQDLRRLGVRLRIDRLSRARSATVVAA